MKHVKSSEHHPSSETLIEYSAGTLSAALSVCVSVHLEYCETCRKQKEKLDSLAGILLEDIAPSDVSNDLLGNIFDEIDREETTRAGQINIEPHDIPEHSLSKHKLPSTINKLLKYEPENLRWRHHGRNVSSAKITQYDDLDMSLILINKGAKIPVHSHKGKEYTLVLDGSFSDEEGIYTQGDFIVCDENHSHSPVATTDSDCLCLVVMDAPLKFNNMAMELYNRVRPL